MFFKKDCMVEMFFVRIQICRTEHYNKNKYDVFLNKVKNLG